MLGKAMAGGKKEIMEGIGPGILAHAGASNSIPLSVQAAFTSFTKILTQEAIDRASMLEDRLLHGYRDVIDHANHTRGDIDANIDTFKEAAEIVKTYGESMLVGEAV